MVVKISVGPDKIPFSIQQDVLCAQSPIFDFYLATRGQDNLEPVYLIEDTDVEAFGCFQSFMFTGEVSGINNSDDFSVLLRAWKLAKMFEMVHFQTYLLHYITANRHQIFSTQNMKDIWEITKVGCPLRMALMDWMVDRGMCYGSLFTSKLISLVREDANLANLLPQEILSELLCLAVARPPTNPAPSRNKGQQLKKRKRNSDVCKAGPQVEAPKCSDDTGTVVRDLEFCRSLINRMLSKRGFWPRFKLFTQPVDPDLDGVPDYLDVIKDPMDLSTVKQKTNKNEYANAKEFEADIRQIFKNCYMYWSETDHIFKLCMELEKAFDNEWAAVDRQERRSSEQTR